MKTHRIEIKLTDKIELEYKIHSNFISFWMYDGLKVAMHGYITAKELGRALRVFKNHKIKKSII